VPSHFIKVGARVPVPYGVGATFVGQFHTKKHYETAIQSECTVSQMSRNIFPVFALKVMHWVILLSWFWPESP